MLEILTLDGIRFDLPIDISIAMVIENPFLVEGRIPLPYSTSFDLPPTSKNLQLFNYPNRLNTYRLNQERSKPCVIMLKGIIIAKGKLVMLSFDTTIKVNFSGIDFNESHRAPLFSMDFETDTINGAYNTVDWNRTGNYAYNYRLWASSKMGGADTRYVIAPIGQYGSFAEPFKWADPVRREGSNIGSRRDLKFVLQNYYYNAFNVSNQSFYFQGGDGNYHASIFPQFRIHYILSKIIGPSLLNNPFSKNGMENLVVPTYYHPNYSFYDGFGPLVSTGGDRFRLPISQPEISFADFFPNLGANEFIRDVLNLFCFTMYAKNTGFNIVANSVIISKPVKHNWSDCLVGNAVVSSVEGKFYDYGYENERPTYKTSTAVINVSSISDMTLRAVSLDSDGMYEMFFYISSTKQYFQKTAYEETVNLGNQTIKELVVDYVFLGYDDDKITEDTSKTKFSVKSNINTPPLHPTVYLTTLDNTGGVKNYITVPMHTGVDNGENSRAKGPIKREDSFEVLLFEGFKNVASPSNSNIKYPFLNPYGSTEVPLVWEGQNGLLEKHHKAFMNWIQKDKLKLQGSFLLKIIQLHQLDITEKINVNGCNFFIEKLQFTINSNSISPVDAHLIEA